MLMLEDKIEKLLLKNNKITSVKRVTLESFIENISDKNILLEIKKNYKDFDLFRFFYSVDNVKVVGFIAIPNTLNLSAKNKTIVCLRGGSKDFGVMRLGQFFMSNSYYSWFPLKGYVTIYTQYRGNGGGSGVDEMGGKDLNDVKRLYKIVKEFSFCDVEKIGLFGWSRGGQMVYQLLKTEKWIKAAIIIAGPTNHLRMILENFRSDWKGHLDDMFGGSMKEVKKRSAIFWANKIKSVPILIIHGTSDDKVDVRDSIDISKLLKQSTLKIFKGDDHNLSKNRMKAKKISLDWFSKNL